MKLESLVVLHLPKHAAAQDCIPFAEGFVLESCLRWVAVMRDVPAQVPQGTQVFQAVDAYRFLMEMACGLHSKIQGESEIFGQLKQAWKMYHEAEAETSRPLHRLMQTLFADVKLIRTEFLQGIGGDSYHSAIHKLLRLRKDQSLLVIGAGQFGAMLAEKLRHKVAHLSVLNRSAHPLVKQAGWEHLEGEIANATHVLVAIPVGKDEALDARIQQAWKQKRYGKLIHLAQMHYCGTSWDSLPHMLGLADVMDIQNNHSHARPQAIANAFTAIRLAAESRMMEPRQMPKLHLVKAA